MWRLPDNREIQTPQFVEIGRAQYGPDIFNDRKIMAALGIKFVKRETFDKEHYRAISWTEIEEQDPFTGFCTITQVPVLEAISSKRARFTKEDDHTFELETSDMSIIDAGINTSTGQCWVKIRVHGQEFYLRGYLNP